ncbi:MAG: tetratricopeptide repeat protein [Halioglobus sp.]
MDQYRTEEEQVEALRRWWDENGRSTIAAIVIAVSLGFGWQTYKANDQVQQQNASDIYQAMLQAVGSGQSTAEQRLAGVAMAEQLKTDFSGTSYAQFAALHLARIAATDDDLAEAEAQLRWVLGKAAKGSDTAQVAQMRLARVVAATGDTDQALAILDESGTGTYQASYAVARGDILLALGRNDEAREAYSSALALAISSQGQVNMPALQQKLQSLDPVPARSFEAAGQAQSPVSEAAAVTDVLDAAADAAAADDAAADAAAAGADDGQED